MAQDFLEIIVNIYNNKNLFKRWKDTYGTTNRNKIMIKPIIKFTLHLYKFFFQK